MSDDSSKAKYTPAQIKEHVELCQNEADECHEAINKEQADYDKQLLTLASGLLAVVVAFVKDVVPLRAAIWVALFYFALAFFIACILCVLISYQVSIFGHYKVRKFWQNHKIGSDYTKFPYGIARWITWINLASGVLFFFAIISLGIFIIANTAKERAMTGGNDSAPGTVVQKGANLRVPPQSQPTRDVNRGLHLKVPAQPVPAAQSQQGNGGGQSGNAGNSQSRQ
jgi:hypothetical protein